MSLLFVYIFSDFRHGDIHSYYISCTYIYKLKQFLISVNIKQNKVDVCRCFYTYYELITIILQSTDYTVVKLKLPVPLKNNVLLGYIN